MQQDAAAPIRIPARDGFLLGATRYDPSDWPLPGDPAVVIAGAAAVRRTYYDAFARHLAGRGFRVVTFDYRGVGDSRPRRLRGFEGSMAEWGTMDLAGVIDWIDATHKPGTLSMVGHSAGGHMLGLAPNNHQFAAILLVASQSGYWGLWDGVDRLAMRSVWTVLIPGVTHLFGYLPQKWLGLGEDLPAPIALEWARWGRHPDFLLGFQSETGFKRLRSPILLLSIGDDFYAPRRAVSRAETWYANAQVERRHIAPADLGVRSIGHFGFFRERFRGSLWTMASEWLKARLARTPQEREA